jgi:predicted nucleotidyltransferase
MEIPGDILRDHPGVGRWSILVGWRGSIAHGMYIPNSDPGSIDDRDVMAVCVPPLDHYLGLRTFGARGTQEIKHLEWDIVVYEARKFISLLTQGNPNVLSLLWLDDPSYIKKTDAGQLLIDHRDLFIGRHVYKSFTGYAYDQLHRMTHMAFKGYMGEKRKRLVEKYGYDTKNAAHLLRLLRMGAEFLGDGRLRVRREDASELLEVKRGEWSLDRVQKEADIWFIKAEEAYRTSPLPPEPDREAINALAVAVIGKALGLPVKKKHGLSRKTKVST